MSRPLISAVMASALLFLFASQASAEGMPAHVQKTLGKFVGEWNMEVVVNGQMFKSAATVKWSDDRACFIISAKGKSFDTGKDISTTEIFAWDGARKLVVEHAFNSDGSGISATHQISEDGEWTSPMNGWTIIDGAPTHIEGFRVFKWKSDNELEVEMTKIVGGGQRAPDMKFVFRRK